MTVFIWVVLAAVIAILVTEAILRLFGFGWRVDYESSGDVLWRPRPDQRVFADGTNRLVTIVEHGLRHVPQSTPRSESAATVLCMGDSVTFGYSLSDQESYPAVLQSELDRQAPGMWNVLNAGCNGYNFALMRKRFHALYREGVRPDIVILGYCHNERPSWPGDHLSADQEHTIRRRIALKNHLRKFAVYNFVLDTSWGRELYRMYLRAMPKQSYVQNQSDAADSAWIERYRRRIETLFQDIRDKGIRVMVLVWPERSLEVGPYRPVLMQECSKHQVPWVDLRFVLVDEEDLGRLYFDPTHPREVAMGRLVKEGIAPFFVQQTSEIVRV